MPCIDERDSLRIIYEKGHDPHYQQEAGRLSKRCQELTDLLCQVGRARYNKANIPGKVLQWWDDHCKLDKAKGEPW